MNEKQTAWKLLACAGSLMLISGVLMALCVSLAIGGVLWAAASLMFLSAYHFRLAEKKDEQGRPSRN